MIHDESKQVRYNQQKYLLQECIASTRQKRTMAKSFKFICARPSVNHATYHVLLQPTASSAHLTAEKS